MRYQVPEDSAAERRIVALVFLVAFVYLLLFRRYTALEPDEGIILQGTQRILHGQVLYRDFFSFFTPGSYYLLALLFRIFGSSMLVARTALAVYGGLLSAFTYLLARRVCSRWGAMLAAYLVTVTSVPWRFLALHNWDSTLWACAAVYCAVRWMEAASSSPSPGRSGKGAWSWSLGMSSFAAFTVLFEQSKGAGLVLGLALGFAIILLLAGRGFRVSRAGWIAIALGFAWLFTVTFGYFAAQHALSLLWADWLWPLHHYSRVNAVPYGYQNWSDQTRRTMFGGGLLKSALSTVLITPCFVLPVLPLIALGLLAYAMTPQGRGKLAPEQRRYYVVVCGAISGLLISVVAARADILHFVYLSPLLYLVFAWLVDSRDFRLSHPLKLLLGGFLFFCFTFLGLAFLLSARGAHFKLTTRRGRVEMPNPDEVLQYTQAHVPAGSKIFVYPYLPLYYYLTATFSPTRYEYLMPGMHTKEQDEEAIRAIRADRTPVALFEPDFNEKIATSWPNTPIQYVANDPVGDYLLEHYRSCKVLRSASGWPFLFMVPKDLACPKRQ